MNLQRNIFNNKLLRFANGKLMRECCCEYDFPACNNCSPPLRRKYTLTISGLYGNWSFHNGVHTLTNASDACTWWGGSGWGFIALSWPYYSGSSPSYWKIVLGNVCSCAVGFCSFNAAYLLNTDKCTPCGEYGPSPQTCSNSRCTDGSICPGPGSIVVS